MTPRAPHCGVFRDKDGVTTVGVAIALLVTLTLVFSSAQVYRVNSASAEAQAVADAAALAAENVVAEFVIVVRVCDATVLTLSLTGLAVMGLGVAALCTPFTAELSATLIDAGKKVLDARDAFAEKSQDSLERLQRALPVLAGANALSVAGANGAETSSFTAVAVLVPWEADAVDVEDDETDDVERAVDENADDLRDKSRRAEEIAERANDLKQKAYEHDCGLAPSHCMYERADTLAGMSGGSNPYYGSVDAWSFSVAMDRAKSYYPARLAQESPEGSSVAERARSALRRHFYEYAVEEIRGGYVNETEDSFDAYFPLLPKNTSEMRDTRLYTQAVYPITQGESGSVMHAWGGCPKASGAVGTGSIAQMESGGFSKCPSCEFSAASMGKVAAASTSIDNGFEHHYRIVAEAARDYQKARDELDPLKAEVKRRASDLFDQIKEAISRVAGKRIDVEPPGSTGAVAIAFSSGGQTGAQSAFVSSEGSLGTRAAVSAATLVEEPAGEGGSVVASALDGLKEDGGSLVGGASVVLGCWSALLSAYADGQKALSGAIEDAFDSIPLVGESGLGTWAKDAYLEAIETVGLQPADLDAAKPVVVNSYHVASQGDGAFCATLVGAKKAASLTVPDVFSALASRASGGVVEGISADGSKVKIATVAILGTGGPDVTLELALPAPLAKATSGLMDGAARALSGIAARISGVREWE